MKIFEKRKDDYYWTFRMNTSANTSIDFSIHNLRTHLEGGHVIAITPNIGIGIKNKSNSMRFAVNFSIVFASIWFCVWYPQQK